LAEQAACREINAYGVLAGKPEGMGPLGKNKSSWESNIKMELKETVLQRVGKIHLTQDRD
jgi:hypothetical protein